MPNHPNEPLEPKPLTKNNAVIWAIVVGLGTAGLVFWILGSQSIVIRLIAGVAGGVAVAISSHRKSVAANSRSENKSDDRSE
ncbi:MAG: hypothetical protein JKY41_09505 [Rhodobacteraceae bacterium]|nr:hypothetical protein [Paracoccaceae bacterium]